jgi:hypothetical protein
MSSKENFLCNRIFIIVFITIFPAQQAITKIKYTSNSEGVIKAVLIAFSYSRDKGQIAPRNGTDVAAGKNFRYLVEIQHVLYPFNDFIMSQKIKNQSRGAYGRRTLPRSRVPWLR